MTVNSMLTYYTFVKNFANKTALLFTILEHKLQPAIKCKHIVQIC